MTTVFVEQPLGSTGPSNHNNFNIDSVFGYINSIKGGGLVKGMFLKKKKIALVKSLLVQL